MNLRASETIRDFRSFADTVQLTPSPVVVTGGGEALLVAMSPDVFEQALFDINLLNCYRGSPIGCY